MKRNILLPIVSLVLGLTSCAHPKGSTGARAIEAARIEKGVTTQQQLVDQLGEPQIRGLDSKGRTMLVWNRMDVTSASKGWIPVAGRFLPRTDTVHEQELVVSIDSRDQVVEWRVKNEQHRYK